MDAAVHQAPWGGGIGNRTGGDTYCAGEAGTEHYEK